MNYLHFDTQDFVKDASFQEWVKNPTPQTEQIWTSFLAENPHKKNALQQAENIILQLSKAEQRTVSENRVQHIWQNIEQAVGFTEEQPVENPRMSYLKVALWATFILALLAISAYFIWKNAQNTEGGQKQTTPIAQNADENIEWQEVSNPNKYAITIKLDDGSTIALEKNSQVCYPQRFLGDKREVYLTGEAFFDVEKNPLKPFLVYSNGIVTKVLGTSFRIKAYQNEPQVVVSVRTGKVSVYEKKVYDAAILRGGQGEVAGMVVTPNQKVVFDREAIQLKKGIVEKPQPLVAASVANRELDFEDIPASVVLKKLSAVYGIPIQFDETLLSKCPLTITLGNETLIESLKAICPAIRAYYEEIDGQIVVTSKGCP